MHNYYPRRSICAFPNPNRLTSIWMGNQQFVQHPSNLETKNTYRTILIHIRIPRFLCFLRWENSNCEVVFFLKDKCCGLLSSYQFQKNVGQQHAVCSCSQRVSIHTYPPFSPMDIMTSFSVSDKMKHLERADAESQMRSSGTKLVCYSDLGENLLLGPVMVSGTFKCCRK